MIRELWTWFWHGLPCTRCKAPTGLRFVDSLCDVCQAVERINLRTALEKRFF